MAHFILINLPERQHLSLRFERTQIPASIIRPSDIFFLAAVFTTSSARTELSPHFFDQFGFSTIDISTNTSLQSSRFNSMIYVCKIFLILSVIVISANIHLAFSI